MLFFFLFCFWVLGIRVVWVWEASGFRVSSSLAQDFRIPGLGFRAFFGSGATFECCGLGALALWGFMLETSQLHDRTFMEPLQNLVEP